MEDKLQLLTLGMFLAVLLFLFVGYRMYRRYQREERSWSLLQKWHSSEMLKLRTFADGMEFRGLSPEEVHSRLVSTEVGTEKVDALLDTMEELSGSILHGDYDRRKLTAALSSSFKRYCQRLSSYIEHVRQQKGDRMLYTELEAFVCGLEPARE